VNDWESIARVLIGLGVVAYGVYLAGVALWKRLPTLRLPTLRRAPDVGADSDVHTVVNISIRLDAAGKTKAADLARGLVQEMLSPSKATAKKGEA
jgi:hypothetical protein